MCFFVVLGVLYLQSSSTRIRYQAQFPSSDNFASVGSHFNFINVKINLNLDWVNHNLRDGSLHFCFFFGVRFFLFGPIHLFWLVHSHHLCHVFFSSTFISIRRRKIDKTKIRRTLYTAALIITIANNRLVHRVGCVFVYV